MLSAAIKLAINQVKNISGDDYNEFISKFDHVIKSTNYVVFDPVLQELFKLLSTLKPTDVMYLRIIDML